MFQTDLNHYEVVRARLAGERAIDAQTYASIAVLEERIKRLRKCDEAFAMVAFSPAVRQLAMQENKIAVG